MALSTFNCMSPAQFKLKLARRHQASTLCLTHDSSFLNRALHCLRLMRVTCYRCFWPQPLCWCGSITPMETRTRFVFLMHPKEFKQEKAATGRLTHLCLARSEIHMGIAFDAHEPVQALLRDPRNHCVLLYPGRDAINLSEPPDAAS